MLKTYNVKATWKNPAWNERDGYTIEIYARTKSDAVRAARSRAKNDGHMGVMYFKATEVEFDESTVPAFDGPTVDETLDALDAIVTGEY